MKNSLIAIALTLYIGSYAQTYEKNFIDQNYIEVIGKAELEIVPDLIYIQILLNEKDNKNKIPVTEQEKQMAAKLTEIGIDITKDLMVADLSSNFKQYLLSKNEIMLSKEYQLVVYDAGTAGKVFIEMEKLGISNLKIKKLDHSRIEEFRKEVKINAIKAAKNKAIYLSDAIEQQIGRAIYIEEVTLNLKNANVNAYSNTAGFYEMYSTSSVSKKGELGIEFEKIKLESAILCRFELK